LEDKCRHTKRRHGKGKALAGELREIITTAIEKLAGLDEKDRRDLVIRAYDCMRWGGISYASRYLDAICELYSRDSGDGDYAATKTSITGLARAMLIKDGIFVAELSTSPEKRARDRRKYSVNPKYGDKIKYKRLWHWKWKLGSWTFNGRMPMSSGVLSLLKRSRWIRKFLPGWHKLDLQRREDYFQAMADFSYSGAEENAASVAALAAPACMNCQRPRCGDMGCPLGGRVPQWIDLASNGKWLEASEVLHERNNFPELTSLICPAPCESQCKKSLVGQSVSIREMEGRIIQRAYDEGWVKPLPAKKKTGKKVAIVGSGPAGLAAAQQLARAGHDVTVFEKDKFIGGLLRYGIPDHRLDRKLIDRRIDQMRAESVTFKTEVMIGRDFSAIELRDQFDAICLATGASRPLDLDVPGRDFGGIHFALDFLRQENLRSEGSYVSDNCEIDAQDKVVAVIGGGLTGEDCVETALSRGAKKVYQFEILPPSIGQPEEISELSGRLERQWCVSTQGFDGSDKLLTDMKCVCVEWK
ncbi:MAG TPA: FAD-dependent oxidoreductase, partial [Phycisphaerae bacterium]|nr:FAD-dependent oxidoreductase [Phycisphaerae bacterium]